MVETNDLRYELLEQWLSNFCRLQVNHIKPLAGDASFRRYFRVLTDKHQFVVMDAPPEKEKLDQFIAMAVAFQASGVRVPAIYETDLEKGFLLLEDFGDVLYLNILSPQTADALYSNAMGHLVRLQTCHHIPSLTLPHFDHATYMVELSRFEEWYLTNYLGLTLTENEKQMLQATYDFLIEVSHEQPQVCVHRDFHSRNLMQLADGKVGVLDFQDALIGPLVYDLMSMLRDCYIHWPQTEINKWLKKYYELCVNQKIALFDFSQFKRWFDLAGVQRHLKVLYIFSRLKLLYGNNNYVQYIPRVLGYLQWIVPQYKELKELNLFLEKRVIPHESHATCRGAGQTLRELNC